MLLWRSALVVAMALMTCGHAAPLGVVRSPRAAPQTVYALPGSTASLPCDVAPPLMLRSAETALEWTRVEGQGQLNVLVLRGAEELPKEQAAEFAGRTALSQEGTLTLRHLTPPDSGHYRCKVRWKGGGGGSSSVWLRVAEAAAVELLLRGSPSHQPPVLCRSWGWGEEPAMSLLDGWRTPLSAETHKGTAQSEPHTVTVTSQERETASGTVICRVEVPELVVEISSSFLPGHSAGLTVGVAAVWGLVGACFGAALVLFFLPVRLVEKLRALPRRWEGPEALTVFEYGDVMLMQTSGASGETARANGVDVEGETVSGVEVSEKLADRDFDDLLKFQDDIRSVGISLQLDPALIAALISRQSWAGKQLTQAGDGVFHSDCFGLMQINRHYHVVEGGPFSRQHLKQGATFLVQMIKTVRMREEWPDWSAEQQLKVALACYIAGQENVFREPSCERMEAITPNGDFANDVVARARRLRQKNF